MLTLALTGCGGKAVLREPTPILTGLNVIRVIDTRALRNPITEPFAVQLGPVYLYLTDRATGELIWADSTGKRLGGGGVAGLSRTGGGYLDLSSRGNLILSDPLSGHIFRFDQRASFRGQVGYGSLSGENEIAAPISAIEANDGTIWVIDMSDERLESISPFNTYADTSADIRDRRVSMRQPSKLSRLRNSDMLLAHTGGQELLILDDRGDQRRTVVLPAGFEPVAAVEGRGDILWAVDTRRKQIIAVTMRGEVKFTAGPLLDGASRILEEPVDLSFRPGATPDKDVLVVTDPSAGFVYFLRPISVTP